MAKYIRQAYGFVHMDPSPLKDVYGGPVGRVFVECLRVYPEDIPSTSVIVITHPIGGGAFLPVVSALAAAGRHVIYCNPRFRGNDSALTMEKCALDLGACIADLKTRFGYEKVILGGWSGGGSFSLFYQDQAENPTISETPAGDPANLIGANLQPVDGIVLLAAHISRATTLTEWLDPSILDEDRPFERDVSLNIYDPDCPAKAPYDEAFVKRFREAQIARNRRITARVKKTLAELKAAGQPYAERAFVTQGTMCDVRWMDPAQDPSDRPQYTSYLGDPVIANDGPVGLARFSTLRSWLSQWSYDDTRADGLGNASRITCPVLVVNNTADLACTPSHAHRLYEALTTPDKEMREVKGADHYYMDTPELLPQAVAHITSWLAPRGL